MMKPVVVFSCIYFLLAPMFAGASSNLLTGRPGLDDTQGLGQLASLIQSMDRRINSDPKDYEAQLLKGIFTFYQGKHRSAIELINQLTLRAPSFHLAHLVRADMLAARVSPLKDIGSSDIIQSIRDEQQKDLDALRQEINTRISANIKMINRTRVPAQLLQLSSDMQTALLVDKSVNRLYLFERSEPGTPPRLVKDFYVSTGQKRGNKTIRGDLKTPEGVYFITSFIPDGELPEKYGIGAFPTNYPNQLDRKLGKTGDGIWLHGTDRIYYSRPPLDSEGCVVLSNIDLQSIKHLIKPGVTPMVIADEIQWIDDKNWHAMRSQVLESVENWRRDWESLDIERYLSHYAGGFWNAKHNRKSWDHYKRRISKQKTYQKVTLSDLSLFFYPKRAAGQDMVLVKFRQDYRSNNFSSEAAKRLYLEREGKQWRILYEGI